MRMLAIERNAASRPTSNAPRAGWAASRAERESGAQPGIRWCGLRRYALHRADSTPPCEGGVPFFNGTSVAARPGRYGEHRTEDLPGQAAELASIG